MPTCFEKVCTWGQTGSHRSLVKTPRCEPVHISRIVKRDKSSDRGLRYLWLREYQHWNASLALRVPITDAAYRTIHDHPELVAPARPVATAAPLLEAGPGNLGLMEGSTKMRLERIAKFLVIPIVILTGSPALARHDGYCHSCVQKAGACRDRTFGTCAGRESVAPRWNHGNPAHDDWSAGMILG
jgi:hypothetical protein